MKTFLGIDYGSKRVGIARANNELRIATPLTVLPNNNQLVDAIVELIATEEIDALIVGHSKNAQGNENSIAHDVMAFIEAIREKTGVLILLEDERYTTQAARRFAEKGSVVDASAAALILQSYLDRAV